RPPVFPRPRLSPPGARAAGPLDGSGHGVPRYAGNCPPEGGDGHPIAGEFTVRVMAESRTP
ncbi:MAG: hypothetical protein ACLQBX_08260, partial [Candidatus Limnocylindrales bacterium]